MKVIIPSAGAGTRLFPHTHTKPKPMVSIAGKPIIGHILDKLIDLEPEEIIFVVGYCKEQLMSYVDNNYGDKFVIRYVNQEKRLGLAHSIFLTRDLVGESSIMIALGDMIFTSGYLDFYNMHFLNNNCSGSIGVRQVDDPWKYGIVELKPNSSRIKKLVEKPESPVSDLAIAGVYFIEETSLLFEIIEQMIENNVLNRGEFQLTDALQEMVSRGMILKTLLVSSWYDCGHAKSLLETNQVLLDEKEELSLNYEIVDSVIVHPVAIGENVRIVNSVIGPYTSIASNTAIDHSVVSNTVVGSRTCISKMNLNLSIIGDDANIIGKDNSLNIGDFSSVEF